MLNVVQPKINVKGSVDFGVSATTSDLAGLVLLTRASMAASSWLLKQKDTN